MTQKINAWWQHVAGERFWLEVRKVPGIGEQLYCPLLNKEGRADSSYALVGFVRRGDVIVHWNVKEQFFCGYSRAAGDASETAERRTVKLKDFNRLPILVTRTDVIRK